MPITTHLSPLTARDIPSLERLEEVTSLSFWGLENYRKFLEEYPEYFGCKVVVVLEAEVKRLAGFLLARSLFDNLEILKLGVFPEYHRRGIGTILMEAAYAEGMSRGCRRCFLEVRKLNRAAIEFYFHHHFKIAGSRINYYSNPVEDAWIMERAL